MKQLVRYALFVTFLFSISHAQIEEVYYESGELKSKTPLNDKGVLEGPSFTYYKSGAVAKKNQFLDGQQIGLEQEYYPNGRLKAESNYMYGRLHGQKKEYYQNGDKKLEETWEYGHRKGVVMLYYPGRKLRMYGIVDEEVVEFAQRFDEQGRMLSERMFIYDVPFDRNQLDGIQWHLKEGSRLVQGANLAQVFIPKVPTRYISFTSPNGRVSFSADPRYPMILRPEPGQTEMILDMEIKSEADKSGQVIHKRIRIPVVHK